jgi:L-lactate dehydrogenase (cytochrome)
METGLDVLRARALGADFVMMGSAFHFALAALGPKGIDHLIDIFIKDMVANMGQIGARSFGDLPAPLHFDPRALLPNGSKSTPEA